MSKLSHSNDEMMDQIEMQKAIDDGNLDLPTTQDLVDRIMAALDTMIHDPQHLATHAKIALTELQHRLNSK